MTEPVSFDAPLQLADGWSTARLADSAFDPQAFAVLERLIQQGEYPNTHAILVEHDGKLVYERYFDGEDEVFLEDPALRVINRDSLHDLRSVSKSVTAVILGLALQGDYRTALAKPITAYFADLEIAFDPRMAEVTLRDVLTMTAGIEWDEWSLPYSDPANDEFRFSSASDPIAFVLSRPVVHPPGRVWVYNGGLTQLLLGIVERETGMPFLRFAEQALFAPLGITDYQWLGFSQWRRSDMPSAPAGLRLRARDLAKIGSLFLRDGRWNSRQVVPAEWVRLSSHRHVTEMPWGSRGRYGYGFQWWPGRSRSMPVYRIIRAAGNGGQRILVVPERHLVVTVFAGNYGRAQQDNGERLLGRIAAAHRQHG